MGNDLVRRLEALVAAMGLPERALLVLHVRLKGLLEPSTGSPDSGSRYTELTLALLEALRTVARPQGILVPSFTYSYTKTARFNRVLTPGEVGRFGEEVRAIAGSERRLVEPVFSFMDLDGVIEPGSYRFDAAFSDKSLFGVLAGIGVVSVNIGVPGLFGTYLHYIEAQHNVPYRFEKRFPGEISQDGEHWEPVDYAYYVRRLEQDTRWRRKRIARDLIHRSALVEREFDGVMLRWCHSARLDAVLGEYLRDDPYYLVRGALDDG